MNPPNSGRPERNIDHSERNPDLLERNADPPDFADLRLPESEMRSLIERFEADHASLQRSLPLPFAPDAVARFRQFYTDWRGRLPELDFDAMSGDGQVDYLLFRNTLDYRLRDLDHREERYAEELSLLPFAPLILDVEAARRRLDPVDAPQIAERIDDLSRSIETVRRDVEASLHAGGSEAAVRRRQFIAHRAVATIHRLKTTLRSWFDFYRGYDPAFTWWVEKPYKRADRALKSYAAQLSEKVVGTASNEEGPPIVGDPLGREALLDDLAHEMIPYAPEELIALANEEFAGCEAAMKAASREMGFGNDWRAALEAVKSQHLDPGRQPERIRQLALEAIEFVDAHDLVTVPPLARETWRMEMMSPQRQLVNPFFLGGEVIAVSFPTAEMTHVRKKMSLRGNNIHFARATVYHELIPGHHLQGFMTERYRPYRRCFTTPFWIEGVALHWEMLFWDLDFARSPENRIGMLFWRSHRCARILFSLKFHLGEMSPDECIDLLVDRVGHERENAVAEVRRSFNGDYPPLYQCAYLLGGLQLRSLHRETVGAGRMTNRQFHDAVLRENAIPIEFIRARLLRQPLTRDFRSQWRFYESSFPVGDPSS